MNLMFKSFHVSLANLFIKEFRKVIIKSLAVSIAALISVWILAYYLILKIQTFNVGWIEISFDTIGGLLVLIVGILIFPSLVSVFSTFFLDEIIDIVEKRFYPTKKRNSPNSTWTYFKSNLRFLLITVAINVVAIPFYLIPIVNLVVFVLANGFLISREYFIMVGLRHVKDSHLEAFRNRHGKIILVTGYLLALTSLIPFVNLFFPIIVTSVMTHLFHLLPFETEPHSVHSQEIPRS